MGFGLWSRISCTVGKALPTGESGPKPEAWSPKPPPLSSSAKELPDVLDVPSGQACRRIVQRIAERLRLGSLKLTVARFVRGPRASGFDPLYLVRRNAFVRIRAARRRVGRAHVAVQTDQMRGVDEP